MGHPQVTMILNTLVWSNLCKDGQLWMGKKKLHQEVLLID